MATLVAIGYPYQGTAEQARETVSRLESDLIIQADQVAAISRDSDGKYHVHTTHGGASAGGGAWWPAHRRTPNRVGRRLSTAELTALSRTGDHQDRTRLEQPLREHRSC